MKFGVVVPPDIDLERTARLAKMIEGYGFDSVWSAERAEQRDFTPAMTVMAQVTKRVRTGVAHSYASSAKYEPMGEPGYSPDRAGSMNLLTSSRNIIKRSQSHAANSCLVQVEKWKQ